MATNGEQLGVAMKARPEDMHALEHSEKTGTLNKQKSIKRTKSRRRAGSLKFKGDGINTAIPQLVCEGSPPILDFEAMLDFETLIESKQPSQKNTRKSTRRNSAPSLGSTMTTFSSTTTGRSSYYPDDSLLVEALDLEEASPLSPVQLSPVTPNIFLTIKKTPPQDKSTNVNNKSNGTITLTPEEEIAKLKEELATLREQRFLLVVEVETRNNVYAQKLQTVHQQYKQELEQLRADLAVKYQVELADLKQRFGVLDQNKAVQLAKDLLFLQLTTRHQAAIDKLNAEHQAELESLNEQAKEVIQEIRQKLEQEKVQAIKSAERMNYSRLHAAQADHEEEIESLQSHIDILCKDLKQEKAEAVASLEQVIYELRKKLETKEPLLQSELDTLRQDLEKRHAQALMEQQQTSDASHQADVATLRYQMNQEKTQALATLRQQLEQQKAEEKAQTLALLRQQLDQEKAQELASLRQQLEQQKAEEKTQALALLRQQLDQEKAQELAILRQQLEQQKGQEKPQALAPLRQQLDQEKAQELANLRQQLEQQKAEEKTQALALLRQQLDQEKAQELIALRRQLEQQKEQEKSQVLGVQQQNLAKANQVALDAANVQAEQARFELMRQKEEAEVNRVRLIQQQQAAALTVVTSSPQISKLTVETPSQSTPIGLGSRAQIARGR